MLVGHFAPALALKRGAPAIPLWALLLAVQAVDIVFFILVFAGIESADVRPGEHPTLIVTQGVWTHSLAMTAAYAGGIAALGWGLQRPREGLVLAAAVASHWFADLLVHVPDLPLAFEQAHALGLGLWRYPIGSWALECGLVVAAAMWLARAPGSRPRRIRSLAIGLCVVQTLSDFVTPVPGSDVELGIAALPLYFAVAAAGWWAQRPSGDPASP